MNSESCTATRDPVTINSVGPRGAAYMKIEKKHGQDRI